MIADLERCSSLDDASLAKARPMALENPNEVAHQLGQLTLYTTYPVRNTPSGFNKLTPLRFDALNEAAAAAAERTEQRAFDVRVWIDAADGQSREAQASQTMNSDNTESKHITIRAVLRPTTRAIRMMSKDGLVERLERPQVPPTVEALVLRDHPLLIAVRVRGVDSPMQLSLREDLKGEPTAMAYSNNDIYLNSRGSYPCWLLIPDARGVEGDQGAALRLTLLDAFHLWRFYYAR